MSYPHKEMINDMAAYITVASNMKVSSVRILSTLRHDIFGIAKEVTDFTPRTKGYSELLYKLEADR